MIAQRGAFQKKNGVSEASLNAYILHRHALSSPAEIDPKQIWIRGYRGPHGALKFIGETAKRRFCLLPSGSRGSRMSRERFDLESPNFYGNLHTRRIYNHTGYDVTIYFWSEVIDVRERAENDALGGYNLDSAKN